MSESATLEPGSATPKRALDLVLVSGLPRSGTSLMMQMLAAGGWPLLHDSERPADADNPEGYFEWEGIKQLRTRPDILREAEGKVLKVVSMMMPLLPNKHSYRVIFMQRPVEQVAESQFRMISRRRGKDAYEPVAEEERAAMEKRLFSHADWTVEHLRVAPNITLLEVDFPALVAEPRAWVQRIAEFAGKPELPAETLEKMAGVVRPELFRNRAPGMVRVTPRIH